ncbi:MAG TPA: HD domain-containing phosphohydrolase, partial [Phycisphaerae bacterium]|nr:HD domain-containing phosphohydrolase [Phycisphaerae bacterium]
PGEHPLYLEQIASRLGERAVAHASAVAHLALLLGIRLQSYLLDQRKRLGACHAVEVVNLGIAGMLHDIGKSKLAPEIGRFCSTCEPDDPALRELWETHPRVGFDAVRRGIEASASYAILHHHQRWDGKGFPVVTRRGQPLQLAGNTIHVFARILHVANLFDRLAHGSDSPEQQPCRPAYAVLHQLRTAFADSIDPVVFRALQHTVPPFPPGTRVTLSDGTHAVVTGVTKDPYRPLACRCRADRWTLQDKVINLADADAPEIESVGGTRVSEFIPPVPVPSVAEVPADLTAPTTNLVSMR